MASGMDGRLAGGGWKRDHLESVPAARLAGGENWILDFQETLEINKAFVMRWRLYVFLQCTQKDLVVACFILIFCLFVCFLLKIDLI